MSKELIKPYGDTLDDGVVQLSFTLPVEHGARAVRAAEMYAEKLNFHSVSVAHAHKIGEGFTFFVVYARATPTLDYSRVKATEVEVHTMDFYEINEVIRTKLNRKLVAVGASIGTDAHTVGIDAIFNMKGYNKDYGLERYPEIEAYNMGSQVSCEELLEMALKVNADAVLISQTVTQKDAHKRNFIELIELLEAERLRDRFLLVAGGPRVSNDLAVELGYEAGFGPGTIPSQVASFMTMKILEKEGKNLDYGIDTEA
ncbi:MAG: cobalamin-dependent protein [Deltaproteobacteria bacterium]|jgi:beta-lysine 5,6-aminomutase beta subunit|nr:cobalamin-dependent protein [Deltaproteobacteria bacterium]